jgi:hypothetical protein
MVLLKAWLPIKRIAALCRITCLLSSNYFAVWNRIAWPTVSSARLVRLPDWTGRYGFRLASSDPPYQWQNRAWGGGLLPRFNRDSSLAMTITLIIKEKVVTPAPLAPVSPLSPYTCRTPSLRRRKNDNWSNLMPEQLYATMKCKVAKRVYG